jgi:hypothetical protein
VTDEHVSSVKKGRGKGAVGSTNPHFEGNGRGTALSLPCPIGAFYADTYH